MNEKSNNLSLEERSFLLGGVGITKCMDTKGNVFYECDPIEIKHAEEVIKRSLGEISITEELEVYGLVAHEIVKQKTKKVINYLKNL